MEPTKFRIVEARFNKGQQISFFLLGTVILLSLIILLIISLNKKIPLQINVRGLAIPVFFVLEYIVAAVAFADKVIGLIDLDEDSMVITGPDTKERTLGYADIERIYLNHGKKIHFLASSRTPKIYRVSFLLKNGELIKLKIENQVKDRQSLLPARIHELSEKWKIPLQR